MTPKTHKRCPKCGEEKPASMFYKDSKDGKLSTYCKECYKLHPSKATKKHAVDWIMKQLGPNDY